VRDVEAERDDLRDTLTADKTALQATLEADPRHGSGPDDSRNWGPMPLKWIVGRTPVKSP